MIQLERFPEIGFVAFRPDVDPTTAEVRARQISQFMRHEVHGPVYEQQFGLRFIDPDPPSGTPDDIPWRIESMRKNYTRQPEG